MTTKRQEQLRRAAQIRSTVVAHCKVNKEPQSLNDILDNPAIKAFAPGKTEIDRILRSMVGKELSRVRIQRRGDPFCRFAYLIFNGDTAMHSHSHAPEPTLPPDVKLTVVKSTGKLRLQYKGLVIELGVE